MTGGIQYSGDIEKRPGTGTDMPDRCVQAEPRTMVHESRTTVIPELRTSVEAGTKVGELLNCSARGMCMRRQKEEREDGKKAHRSKERGGEDNDRMEEEE